MVQSNGSHVPCRCILSACSCSSVSLPLSLFLLSFPLSAASDVFLIFPIRAANPHMHPPATCMLAQTHWQASGEYFVAVSSCSVQVASWLKFSTHACACAYVDMHVGMCWRSCVTVCVCVCWCVHVCCYVCAHSSSQTAPCRGGHADGDLAHLVCTPWTVDSGPLSTLYHWAMDSGHLWPVGPMPVQESGEKMRANARLYLADAHNTGWKCV